MSYSLLAVLLLLTWVGIMFFSYRRWKPWRHQGTWKQLAYVPFAAVYYFLLTGSEIFVLFENFSPEHTYTLPVQTLYAAMLVLLAVPAYIWFGMKYSDEKAEKRSFVELSEEFLLIVDIAFFYNIQIGWLKDFPGITGAIPALLSQQNPFFVIGILFFAIFLLNKQVWFILSLIDMVFPRSQIAHFLSAHSKTVRVWRNSLLAPFGFASMICYILGYLTIPFFR